MNSRTYAPDQLSAAIKQSRALATVGLDVLCDLITAVTGVTPNRERVDHVSRTWLWQFCDRLVYHHGTGHSTRDLRPESIPFGGSTSRSRVLSAITGRSARVAVIEPYLKITSFSEVNAVLASRGELMWSNIPRLPQMDRTVNGERRLRFAAQQRDSIADFPAVAREVALCAPIGLVEAHHDLAKWAAAKVTPKIGVLYTANAHQSSLLYRHWSFAQQQSGTMIAVHQHGGGYGIDECHIGEEMDIDLSDVFYTFGWSRADLGDRVRPLPTAMPERSRRESRHGVLLMSLPVTDKFLRFQSFLVPDHIERAIAETSKFVAGLSKDVSFTLRSSGSDHFPVERLEGRVLHVRVDDGKQRGSVAASEAKVVVHNYLGTSWLETLGMNIPTVAFVDSAMYRPKAEARPFLDSLRRVGVLHDSGREAAAFVNSLHGDPSQWWNSDEVQRAREAFVTRYANFSDDWLDAWRSEFARLLDAH